jgi:ATP-dependent RNA helicase DDX54/DBP10
MILHLASEPSFCRRPENLPSKDMAKFTDLRIVSIIGGDAIEGQFEALSTHPDIIIATPGRLMHQIREVSTFKLKHVQYLVFDEADRLFEMGASNYRCQLECV